MKLIRLSQERTIFLCRAAGQPGDEHHQNCTQRWIPSNQLETRQFLCSQGQRFRLQFCGGRTVQLCR